jgi:hypothetical protein
MEIELPPDFKEFLKLLKEKAVSFLLPHYKLNKKAAGHLKNLADLENLP